MSTEYLSIQPLPLPVAVRMVAEQMEIANRIALERLVESRELTRDEAQAMQDRVGLGQWGINGVFGNPESRDSRS